MKLLRVPLKDSSLHKDSSQTYTRFVAEATLNQLRCSKNISERQRLEIWMDCIDLTPWEVAEKGSGASHRSMHCLDSRCKQLWVSRMKRMLLILVEVKRIDEECVKISSESLGSFVICWLFSPNSGNFPSKQIEWTPCCIRQWGPNHQFPESGTWRRFY